MTAHLLPRDPTGSEVEGSRSREPVVGCESRKFGCKCGERRGARQVAGMLELSGKRCTERFDQYGGSSHRRQRFEQLGALRRELLDAARERQLRRDSSGQMRDALGLGAGEFAIDRLEVVEVMEDEAERDACTLGDASGGRAEIAIIEEIE